MKFQAGVSPHLRSKESIPRIMWWVVGALAPSIIMATAVFGFRAIYLILVSTVACLITEYIIQKWRNVPVTINDGSAVITGILLAMCLGTQVSSYIVIIGAIIAIGVAKQLFGGLGMNIWNPALVGRAFIQAAFPEQVNTYAYNIPSWVHEKAVDAITSATPLQAAKTAALNLAAQIKTLLPDLIIGSVPGSLGETSAIAIILGGIILISKGYINWRMPLSFIAFTLLFCLILPGKQDSIHNPLFHLFSGGLVLGAFFMATDMVTTPLTNKGTVIFGAGCGFLVALIRLYGGYPEGVCYAILLMNTTTPIIDRYVRPRVYGTKIKEKNK